MESKKSQIAFASSDTELRNYAIDRFFLMWLVAFVSGVLVKYEGLIRVRVLEMAQLSHVSIAETDSALASWSFLTWSVFLTVGLRLGVFVFRYLYGVRIGGFYSTTEITILNTDYLKYREPFASSGHLFNHMFIKKVSYAEYGQGVYVYTTYRKGRSARKVEAILTKESFQDFKQFLGEKGIKPRKRVMFSCTYHVRLLKSVFFG